jgi:hypothetical protein
MLPTGITVHWIFASSNHGKRDYDTHGAVIKTAIHCYVLNGMSLIPHLFP